MDGQMRRRSSILKPQQPLQVGNQEFGEVSMTTSNLVKRRVSFHNMRTVQEFDQERNDITRSPLKEPIKLGDTGSSDGLHSTRASTFTLNTDQMNGTDHEKIRGADGINKTVDNFLPMSASTPMPHGCVQNSSSRINTLYLFGPDSSFGPHGEHSAFDNVQGNGYIDADVTLYGFGSINDTKCPAADSDATNNLFGPVPCGYVETAAAPVAEKAKYGVSFIHQCISLEPEEDVTRQLFGLSVDAGVENYNCGEDKLLRSNVVDDTDLTGNLFDLSPCNSHAKEDAQTAFHNNNLQEDKDDTASSTEGGTEKPPINTEVQDLTVVESWKNENNDEKNPTIVESDGLVHKTLNHSIRIIGSPLAVVKKKLRLESPLKKDLPLPSHLTSEGSVFLPPASLQHTPLRNIRNDPSTLADTTTVQLSPALQAIAKTRRYIRQSLDQSITRSAPFSSPMIMLQDIMRPKHSISSMSDDQDSEFLYSAADQSPSRFPSMLRSFGNERMPEKTYVSFEESGLEPLANWNESCALTCQFDSVDFDIRIADVPCFQSKSDDHLIVSRLRDVARRNICKELTALNFESESKVEADLKNLSSKNRRLAIAIRMLNPKKLSRDEARAFEVCRFKAQKTWYKLREEVAAVTIDKTTELIAQRREVYEKRLNDLKILEKYRHVSSHEKVNIKSTLERLRQIEKLAVTGFEKNKFELASIRESIHEKKLENIRMKTQIAKIETEILNKGMELLLIKKQNQRELVSKVHQQCEEAKLFYLTHIKNFSNL